MSTTMMVTIKSIDCLNGAIEIAMNRSLPNWTAWLHWVDDANPRFESKELGVQHVPFMCLELKKFDIARQTLPNLIINKIRTVQESVFTLEVAHIVMRYMLEYSTSDIMDDAKELMTKK